MFSEYASRFLAQSQSRLSGFAQPAEEPEPSNRRTTDWHSRPQRGTGRSFLGRGFRAPGDNPYQSGGGGSRFGTLGFASRLSTAPQDAPLFHSIRGDIHEEDDEERDREAADLYALHQSRRVFAAGRLDESSEVEGERSRASLEESLDQDHDDGPYTERARGLGIRSSWNGTRSLYRTGQGRAAPVPEESDPRTLNGSDDGHAKMVDIGLNSEIFDNDNDPPIELTAETPDDAEPAPFQKLRGGDDRQTRYPARRDSTNESEVGLLPENSIAESIMPATDQPSDGEMFKHDPFFAWIFLISFASLIATFVLVWLHTSTGGRNNIGDTIYTTLHASFHLLAVDTLVAIVVSLVWLAALRSFARYLIAIIVVAVPVVLFSFSLYPLVSSYQGREGGSGVQDWAMRWASVIPGISAVIWLYLVWKGRFALRTAIEILEFSSRILAANSALVLVGMGCLALVVCWTWVWLAMFTRIFLGGYFSSRFSRFIISASSWWLGAFFILMYIWTLSIISGVQRGTTAATVSQWYFHRNAQPAPSSREVVTAALNHASTTIFGTISLSTLLAVVIRLPLLILPRRLANLIGVCFYSFVPASITALTNPLTLTYAAIHSQNLAMSARGLAQMEFLAPEAPTTTLTPRAFRGRGHMGTRSAPLLPYRVAKLLLHATRFMMATALGFAGWVMTARQLRVSLPDGNSSGPGIRGSAYAYVVGLIASFIGWGVLGAMEGILSSIVDAVVICYGSETRMASGGGGYCMEAAALFGDRSARPGRDEEESMY